MTDENQVGANILWEELAAMPRTPVRPLMARQMDPTIAPSEDHRFVWRHVWQAALLFAGCAFAKTTHDERRPRSTTNSDGRTTVKSLKTFLAAAALSVFALGTTALTTHSFADGQEIPAFCPDRPTTEKRRSPQRRRR